MKKKGCVILLFGFLTVQLAAEPAYWIARNDRFMGGLVVQSASGEKVPVSYFGSAEIGHWFPQGSEAAQLVTHSATRATYAKNWFIFGWLSFASFIGTGFYADSGRVSRQNTDFFVAVGMLQLAFAGLCYVMFNIESNTAVHSLFRSIESANGVATPVVMAPLPVNDDRSPYFMGVSGRF